MTNDVSCSHAATVGEIDEKQIFYLSSRGLPQEEAKRLIAEGFLK
jgi:Fe-S cluster assembly scaffold protein SufB